MGISQPRKHTQFILRFITEPQPGPLFNYPANELKPSTIHTSREERAAIVDRFGSKLIDVVGEGQQNIFHSPLSIHEALTLAASGSAKTTLDAFVRVLELPKEKSSLNFQAFLTAVNQRENTIQVFKVSISLWLSSKLPKYEDFIDHSRFAFKAESEQLDFYDKDSVKKINECISENTHGKITQIVKELRHNQRLIIINTIYQSKLRGEVLINWYHK
ncbi:MAG: hypothetical protein EZS28_006014 [Streblomastix strix]|uniref:Serpin domain-containing protein n=1 Tax=Streblomastix strix TaxID=222440 RepID=A0A5J4WW61_9EUKA|nr:MAG: hypothetical protein EZS28_006014 [Streblomastix strix]